VDPRPHPDQDLGVAREVEDHGVVLRYTAVSETYDVAGRTRTTVTRYERVTPTRTVTVDREWILHWHTAALFTRRCAGVGLHVTTLIDDKTSATATESSTSLTATLRRA
jgi:hypothetical protein